jgi:hypothetical protein
VGWKKRQANGCGIAHRQPEHEHELRPAIEEREPAGSTRC